MFEKEKKIQLLPSYLCTYILFMVCCHRDRNKRTRDSGRREHHHQIIRASEHPSIQPSTLSTYFTSMYTRVHLLYIPRTKECTKIFVLSTIFSASDETTEHRCIYFYRQVVREIYPRRRHFHKAALFPAFRFIGVFGLNGLHHS